MLSVLATKIKVRKDYWRPYDDSFVITYCYNYPINCEGDWNAGDKSCAIGHIGALCEQCDLYGIRSAEYNIIIKLKTTFKGNIQRQIPTFVAPVVQLLGIV